MSGGIKMHKLYELKEKLMRELEDYSENGKFSKEDVEAIKYITSAIDHICNIMENEDEYSNTGMMGGGPYSYADDGRGGNRGGRSNRSYARGRGRNARRDRMGRYSSEGGYSYDFKVDLEELMQDAPNERVKMKLREVMQEM